MKGALSRVMNIFASRLVGLLVSFGLLFGFSASADQTLVDAHVHFKWTQEEVTSPEQAIEILQNAGVEMAVVIGTPADMALELKRLAPERIVTLFGPYAPRGANWQSWQFSRPLIEQARLGLASGDYQGIGELHLIGGFARRWDSSPVLQGFLDLAREFDVPLLLHVEFANARPMLDLCRANPAVKLVLAHAGAPMKTDQVEQVLKACPRVWMELAARDAWRYVRSSIVDDAGRLLPEWEALVLRYPERFLIGSDNVWPVDRIDSWDEPDTGWQRLGEFLDFHRRWRAHLPVEVRNKVGRENAKAAYGIPNTKVNAE